ncbi:MAG: alanyl-tRNA editing protein, partial [Gemmatimonadales bacterium]|nr:alanyl-tRNA editing protein [Gemmatimonadales bacterium]
MTRRGYYHNSYTRDFPARVVELTSVGGRPAAILEETYFYPTSGGQPHDTGRIGGAGVTEVLVRETDGAVLHLLESALPAGDMPAAIDWPRRFDHMQQHTGQHILSRAFIRAADATTIGFHLGADSVTIDLDNASLRDSVIADAQEIANQVVSDNLEVRAWFPTDDELAALALRKTPEVDGPLRVVAIGDFDHNACGGTHVARTGEIGGIAILRTERMKRGTRVEFLSGGRAHADYARKHRIVRELAGTLSCLPGELIESVERLQRQAQEMRKELAVYREAELDTEAAELVARAPTAGARRIVLKAWADRPIEEVRGLVARVTSAPGIVMLAGVAGARAQIVFGRSEDVALDLKPAFDGALSALGGGRGGGGRVLQGAAGAADLAAVERALAAAK